MTTTFTRAVVAAAAAGSLLAAPAMMTSADAAPIAAVVVAGPGSHGATVRTIQNDLKYLGYFHTNVGGDYLTQTTAAVKKFQAAHKLPVTGVTDSRTYSLLRSTSDNQRRAAKAAAATRAKAAAAAKAKAAAAAKAKATATAKSQQAVVARPGDRNATVRTLQANLAKLGQLNSSQVIGVYGPATTAAVKRVQASYRSAQTGVTTRHLYELIAARAAKVKTPAKPATPAVKLDSRCLVGRTICVNKSTRMMYWVVNGSVKASYPVRVGRPSLPTREGLFHIYLKSPNWYSTLYHVNMPYTQFFSGGEAVHYSVDFATNGYAGGGSHGCVNMKSRSGAAWLYSQTKVGDRVVVYR